MESGQQKLSRPAILSTLIPAHTALRTASSIDAAAIAPASRSEYLGAIPHEITKPCGSPWIGAITPASPGPSRSTPTNGLITV